MKQSKGKMICSPVPHVVVLLMIACTVVTCLPLQQNENLFSSLPTCRRSSPQLSSCVQKWLSQYLIYLQNGSQEMGIPPLDPIEIPFLETRNVDGNITLFLHLKNIKMYGFRGIKVINVKASLEEYKLEITSKMEALSIQGEYVSEGRILQFPLASDGHFQINFTDVTAAWIIYLQTVRRNRTDYLQIDGLNLDMMPTTVNFKVGDLLNGDNTLGDALNMVLNENSSEVYNHIKGSLVSIFSHYFTEIANTVLNNYPEKQLFPD